MQEVEQGLSYMCSQVNQDPAATADMLLVSGAIAGLVSALGPVLTTTFVAEVMELSGGG